jgi:hypothetical protein
MSRAKFWLETLWFAALVLPCLAGGWPLAVMMLIARAVLTLAYLLVRKIVSTWSELPPAPVVSIYEQGKPGQILHDVCGRLEWRDPLPPRPESEFERALRVLNPRAA